MSEKEELGMANLKNSHHSWKEESLACQITSPFNKNIG